MGNLQISGISIEPIPSKDGLIGFANFVINNSIKICNVAIHTCPSHSTNIRLVFPTKEHNGIRLHTVYPINQDTYEAIVIALANVYEELMSKLR